MIVPIWAQEESMKYLPTALLLLGGAAIVTGVALMSIPLALIAAGVLMSAAAIMIIKGGGE